MDIAEGTLPVCEPPQFQDIINKQSNNIRLGLKSICIVGNECTGAQLQLCCCTLKATVNYRVVSICISLAPIPSLDIDHVTDDVIKDLRET